MELSITAATNSGGGTVVSFGAGDSTPGGRAAKSAQGRAGNTNASRAQITSLRARIRREGRVTGNSRDARGRRALLKRLDAAASKGGNIRRRVLAQIAVDLAAL
jgi:hypothetical protein